MIKPFRVKTVNALLHEVQDGRGEQVCECMIEESAWLISLALNRLAAGTLFSRSDRMKRLRDVWDRGSDEQVRAIWALQDGYGEPGLVPPQGYDWSGIRDSSMSAVIAMYAKAKRMTLVLKPDPESECKERLTHIREERGY